MGIEIPRSHLSDLGFEEVTDDLFMKKLTPLTTLYRDYRNEKPTSYGYHRNHPIDITKFKEFEAIHKIELFVNRGNVLSYAM